MHLENKDVPEGINYSQENPLKGFIVNISILGVFLAALIFALGFLAEHAAQRIPFNLEIKIAEKFKQESDNIKADKTKQKIKPVNADQQTESYLQQLANRLTESQTLPEGMIITVHYINDDTVNAFATLGGNIMLHRGLIEKLPNENALAMVLAHEIAHIKYRHPITALSRGLVIAIGLSSLTGTSDSGLLDGFIQTTGNISVLNFSREQEREADEVALNMLQIYYGHTQGTSTLFQVLQQEHDDTDMPAFLSTHPLTENRLSHIKNFQDNQATSTTPELTPLPDYLSF